MAGHHDSCGVGDCAKLGTDRRRSAQDLPVKQTDGLSDIGAMPEEYLRCDELMKSRAATRDDLQQNGKLWAQPRREDCLAEPNS